MARVLQRNLGPVQALTHGQWTDRTVSGEPALCCPECGEISDLEAQQVPVKPSNRVRYLWQCPSERCGFADFLELEAFCEEVAWPTR